MDVEIVESVPLVVKVAGDVELPDVNKLRSAISAAAIRSAAGFIIDMSEVSYIDSAGIAAIVYAYRQLSKSNGKLGIVAKTRTVKRIFELTRLSTLRDIYICDSVESVTEAIMA